MRPRDEDGELLRPEDVLTDAERHERGERFTPTPSYEMFGAPSMMRSIELRAAAELHNRRFATCPECGHLIVPVWNGCPCSPNYLTKEEPMTSCGAQHYWYDNGVARARFCGAPATRLLTALDGSSTRACPEHAADMIAAGAVEVTSVQTPTEENR